MVKTKWKSKKEIEYSLKDVDTISLISCASCAYLCDTGGDIGIDIMTDLVKSLGKKVVFSESVVSCCYEDMMSKVVRKYHKRISKSDALVVLSCASGIKTAHYATPEVPVIAVLDSVGITPVISRDNPSEHSTCTLCGHCVLTYTGMVCPVTECPAKSKYGPCKKVPQTGSQCSVLPSQNCIWKVIEKESTPESLTYLSQIHKDEKEDRYIPTITEKAIRPSCKKIFNALLPTKLIGVKKMMRCVK